MLNWLIEAVASATATMTFFGIFAVGTAFSLFSLIMGGHDEGGDDIGHDLSAHDVHSGDGGEGESDFFNVGVLSVRGMALLATGFGGVGFLVQIYTGKVLFSTLSGLIFGYIFSFVVLYVMKMFRAQQANSLVSMDQAQGKEATVVISIPANGAGEVRFELAGQEMVKMAISKDGNSIRSGSSVRIVKVDGGSLVVSTLAE